MTKTVRWRIRIRDGGRWKVVGVAWLSGDRLRIRIDLGILGTAHIIGFPVESKFE